MPLEFGVAAGVLDPVPLIVGLVRGLGEGTSPADLAAGFHEAVIAATAQAVCQSAAGIGTVGLTGGVFVNRILREDCAVS